MYRILFAVLLAAAADGQTLLSLDCANQECRLHQGRVYTAGEDRDRPAVHLLGGRPVLSDQRGGGLESLRMRQRQRLDGAVGRRWRRRIPRHRQQRDIGGLARTS